MLSKITLLESNVVSYAITSVDESNEESNTKNELQKGSAWPDFKETVMICFLLVT